MIDCSSAKKGFHSHDAAMRSARRQMVRNRGITLRVYHCEECKHWHMTSTVRKPHNLREERYLRMRQEWEIQS